MGPELLVRSLQAEGRSCCPVDDPALICIRAACVPLYGAMRVEELKDGPGETTLGEAELAG